MVIEYNSFLSTDKVAIKAGNTNVSAINNYWNTTDTAVIQLMIYDRNDDINIGGYVEYTPFLTEPHPDTPIPDFNQAPTAVRFLLKVFSKLIFAVEESGKKYAALFVNKNIQNDSTELSKYLHHSKLNQSVLTLY